MVSSMNMMNAESETVPLGYHCYKQYPFQRGTLFSLIIVFIMCLQEKRVPLSIRAPLGSKIQKQEHHIAKSFRKQFPKVSRLLSLFFWVEITHHPALGMMRLIARKMLYVRCVRQCLQSESTSTWQEKINIPPYSDNQCYFCVAGQDLQSVLPAKSKNKLLLIHSSHVRSSLTAFNCQ